MTANALDGLRIKNHHRTVGVLMVKSIETHRSKKNGRSISVGLETPSGTRTSIQVGGTDLTQLEPTGIFKVGQKVGGVFEDGEWTPLFIINRHRFMVAFWCCLLMTFFHFGTYSLLGEIDYKHFIWGTSHLNDDIDTIRSVGMAYNGLILANSSWRTYVPFAWMLTAFVFIGYGYGLMPASRWLTSDIVWLSVGLSFCYLVIGVVAVISLASRIP
jgi:hypothetical protein